MVFIARQEVFVCGNCQVDIQPLAAGSYRNHCPHCLFSKHVDEFGPGDREATCLGLMKPVGLDSNTKKGFVILHECTKCDKKNRNKSAPDDDLTVIRPPNL